MYIFLYTLRVTLYEDVHQDVAAPPLLSVLLCTAAGCHIAGLTSTCFWSWAVFCAVLPSLYCWMSSNRDFKHVVMSILWNKAVRGGETSFKPLRSNPCNER